MSFSSPNTIEKERYYDFIFKNLSHIMILRAVGHACCVSVAVWDTLTKKFPCPEMGLIIKIHNFHPIIMKLGENDQLMIW